MKDKRPVIGITMGDPVGVGPEIILSALADDTLYTVCTPLVLGDAAWLAAVARRLKRPVQIRTIEDTSAGSGAPGIINILNLSSLDPNTLHWGRPTVETGKAMVRYITTAVDMALRGDIAAIVTCPINKKAMEDAGYHYNGHTELLAEKTHTAKYAMMLAGDKLRVVLVTIHTALRQVPGQITPEAVLDTIRITSDALSRRFGMPRPRIAVAALNPHAGEGGMFGDEEKTLIEPAIDRALRENLEVTGPHPPDTVFYHAANGRYDAVVSMYHDQGLIPFKMLHFTDGVNTTLGLPVIRTSVDHGTAYDIAGKGLADPGSLMAAVRMAVHQAVHAINA